MTKVSSVVLIDVNVNVDGDCSASHRIDGIFQCMLCVRVIETFAMYTDTNHTSTLTVPPETGALNQPIKSNACLDEHLGVAR